MKRIFNWKKKRAIKKAFKKASNDAEELKNNPGDNNVIDMIKSTAITSELISTVLAIRCQTHRTRKEKKDFKELIVNKLNNS